VTETNTLSNVELDLIFFIERYVATNGQTPTRAQIDMRFTGLDDDFFAVFDNNPLVQRSFKHRGIVYPAAGQVLTDQQMHAISVMTDPLDRRSDAKKLTDIGITTRQWATWLLEDQFAEYVNERSERLFANSTFEAHKGVIKGARNGNVAAAKLLYEVTGRYRPNEEQQIDVRRILHTFIEVLQKYVKDPIVLHAIAMDLSSAASAESYSNGLSNQMMAGAQNVQARQIAGRVESSTQAPLSVPVPTGIIDDE
jgi:hypothetical protein